MTTIEDLDCEFTELNKDFRRLAASRRDDKTTEAVRWIIHTLNFLSALNNEALHLLHDLNPYEQETINSADKLIGSAKQRIVLGFDSRLEMGEKR